MENQISIGLLGYGTVGKGVYDIITSSTKPAFANIKVLKILVKDESEVTSNMITTNPDEILNNTNINVVVEAMGGVEPAHTYIVRALTSGKSVVTSNKAVVAAHLREFVELAATHHVSFRYEAAVCGGIPWIASVEKVKRIDDISSVSGIYNGTTNFILDAMAKQDVNFADILKEAQKLGYAEADPSADIDGIDVQRKLAITASLAFDTIISTDDVVVAGIRHIDKQDIVNARNQGYVIKLIAKAVCDNSKYAAIVEPVFVSATSLEANVPSNFNLASVTGSTVGELKFYGQGAGKLPTGNAIVQDTLDIGTSAANDFTNNITRDDSLISGKYYVRRGDTVTIETTRPVDALAKGIFYARIED